MNKIEKFLKKLSKKERLNIEKCIKDILTDNTSHLDIKKLVGRGDIFRARKGSIRIVYQKNNKNVKLLLLEKRSDDTYSNL